MDFDLGTWGKLLAGAAAVALAAAAVYLAAEIPLPDPAKQTVASGTATRRAARPTAKDLRGASPPWYPFRAPHRDDRRLVVM